MREGFAIELLSLALWGAVLTACSGDTMGPVHTAGAGAGGGGASNGGGGSSVAGHPGDSAGSAGSAGMGMGGSAVAGGSANGGTSSNTGGTAGQLGRGGQPSGGSGPSNPGPLGPHLIGRFDLTKPEAPVFAWPGTAVSLRFTGAAVGVTLSDNGNNVFEVVLDNKHTVLTLQAGTKKYMLGTGLSSGIHELLLYRRTEASFNETTLNGFDLPDSAYLPANLAKHRLEVIGDSISAGYGNEGTLPCQFTAATENQYLSYEAIAARAVDAELYTEAWSGIGMLHNYEGSTTDQMPVRYLRTLPERATSSWDFSKFVPEAVVINLGTNDFSMGDPGADFQTAYVKFVTDLRGHYPSARFFLAVGSMLSDDNYNKAAGYLKAVIAARASAGDKNLTLLEFGTQDGNADGFGCDYHPTLKTHQKMADKLIAALKTDLGW
ncbi:MAG TPA: SGNH/GDSL hydrolase family protein [Polyangiaceae bacterium]|nr:SGNH/GDSL hydrolase family protein [Polyangiaceae bacterium]